MIATMNMPKPENLFWESPAGRKILAQAAESQLADRRKAVEQIEAAKAKRDAEIPGAVQKHEQAKADYAEALKTVATATNTLARTRGALMTVGMRCDNACVAARKLLKATADPRIEQLRIEISEVFHEAQQSESKSRARSERTAIDELCQVRLKAMRELTDELPLLALTEDELTERLDAMRAECQLTN